MAKYFFIFLISVFYINAFGQIKKSQVIIYGDNEASWAAAVQSARSGVNTLWLRNKKDIGIHFIENSRIQILGNYKLDAGLWAEFLQKTRRALTPSDSISILAKQDINSQIAKNVFTAISDSLKNLNILFNIEIKSISKSGKQWQVLLSNNNKLKVSSIVDGSDDLDLLKLIKAQNFIKPDEIQNDVLVPSNIYNNTLFRTGLVVFEGKDGPTEIPASSLLSTSMENFFIINQLTWLGKEKYKDINNLPVFIQSGQAIGASAAYCAFFKTTNDKIDIRTLQGELLAYHGQIMPYQDIELDDPHFSAIQRIGATGILKGETNRNRDSISFNFNPKKIVSSKEIEPVLLSLYTRSQIWFNNKDIESLTLENLLSLIKFTALKGEELDVDVTKGWTQRFHFTGEFNLTENLTRRQLAVLIDYYLKPFNVKVEEKGKFKY